MSDTSIEERPHNRIAELEAEIARLTAALQERRPFSDALAQQVIDRQVKEIDRLTARIAKLEAERDDLKDQLHYCNGTCDLAMRHRDEAEAERDRLKETLRVAGIRIASLEAADEAALSDPSGE